MAMPVTYELTPEELFCLEGCRTYPLYVLMRNNFERNVCTFCELNRDLNQVIWEDELAVCWTVPQSLMREELAQHFIIIPKRHVRFESELSDDEVLAIHVAKKILASSFDIPGGMIATRFGDMRLNAGTVPHLHSNIMVPSGISEVRIPILKEPADREKNITRARAFAKRYEAGEAPN